MRLMLITTLALVAAACNPGEKNTEKTVTDTTVTPTHATDTTVVQKKVDVQTDTLKKTKNAKEPRH
jgi:hypothetical protein